MLTEESTTTPRTNGLDGEVAKQVSASPGPGYVLTHGEQNVFASMNQQILQAKIGVYNLNAALEKQLKEVDRLESQFGGALALLANSHGMSQAQITPDFTRIDPPKEQR
jgi:hypothetical protein